jgi:hypothetical protein
LSSRARTDDKIKLVLLDRPDQIAHKFLTIAAITVDKHDDVGVRFERGIRTSPARSPITASRLLDNGRARILGSAAVASVLPLSTTMISSTTSRGIERTTSPMTSASFNAGMTKQTI